MHNGNTKRKQPFVRKQTIIVIGAIIALFAIGGVLAKYIYDNAGRNLLSAKAFYFTSDLLKDKTEKYILNSAATEVSFTLGNNADKLRVSEVDIQYTVSVTTKNGGAIPEIVDSNTERKFLSGTVSRSTITLKNLVQGETYVVTATGKAGYKQTLSAEFTVSRNDKKIYKHLDTSNEAYVLLTVWTENVSGELTVRVPDGLIPDNTDPILREVYNYKDSKYGEFAFADAVNFEQTYSSYMYRFFTSEGEVHIDDFQISISQNGTIYLAGRADIPK